MNFSDYSPLFTPRAIGICALVIVGGIALGFAIVLGGNAFQRYATGWKQLTKRFPATEVHKFGGSYKRQTGFFDITAYGGVVSGAFLVELAQEGVLVTANFARTPLLIPWSAIRDVTETNMLGLKTCVRITADYEPILAFTIPKDALIAIQENVSTDRFHQADFVELVKKKFLDAIHQIHR